MPELPDITLYVEALARRVEGATLEERKAAKRPRSEPKASEGGPPQGRNARSGAGP